MVTVLNSVGSRLRVFSKVRLTSARPLALRVLEPLNTRLSKFSERRCENFLFANNPADAVNDIAFAAAVWAHDAGNVLVES